ncbi:sugar phosphate isomerase/epimerase [Candidatus Desantisbacteria bacterium]|nr:sugar phosphate isomerase/epimerase [Candidatus Desantisbacteria bacterium]
MKFGLSVLIFGHDDVMPYLSLLAESGIEYIEIRGYPPRIEYDDMEYIEELRTALFEYNIKIHSFHLPFNNIDISSTSNDKWQKSVDEVLKGVKICKKLGGTLGVLHPGAKYGEPENKKAAEEASYKGISVIFKECEKHGIKLAVENMLPGRVGEDFDFFENLFKKINSQNIGLCFDSSHANVNGTIYDFLKKSGDKLLAVHFSDNMGKADDHFFPFDGNIDWSKIVNILHSISFNSVFMLEVAAYDGLTPLAHIKSYQETVKKLNIKVDRLKAEGF